MNDKHGPLELPDKSVSDDVMDKLSTLRKVRDRLAEKGVPLDMKPEYDLPEMPADLSTLTDKELGDLYGRLMGWDNYFSSMRSQSEAEVKEHKNKLEVIIVKLSGGKRKRDHSMDIDERVIAARAELQAADQAAVILKSTHSIYSNQLKMVSRMIELRKMEWEKSQREDNIQRTPRTPKGVYPSSRHSKFDGGKRDK